MNLPGGLPFCCGLILLAGCQSHGPVSRTSDTETVGYRETQHLVLPANQVVTPLGRQVDLAGLRPQGLALSPDGRTLIVSGKTSELLVLDPKALTDPVLRADAMASARMNFREVDRAPEDALNRILWRAMKGTAEPYPEWAVTTGVEEDEDED
jgi:hypothetical protein